MTSPAIFFGHGSPMNAIEDNLFTQKWREVMVDVKKPKAIIIISAHWLTNGTKINSSMELDTIHDFGGFPQKLFDVQYPAKGDPKLAKSIANKLNIELDDSRGLDHGVWSVLTHIYPHANIPVLQLSLDYNKTPEEHFQFAQKLTYLREEGIMIIGSGNIVHNLNLLDWNDQTTATLAKEFNEIIIGNINSKNFENIINYVQYGEIAGKSVPSVEHFLPLLYVLGATIPKDKVEIFNQDIVMGSLAMTSVKFG
jgi:4,5-DOPA dioxygenase extradiol